MKKLGALFLIVLVTSLIAPTPAIASTRSSTTSSVEAVKEVLGCNDEPVESRPYVAPPFRYGPKVIHFGYLEWHFPPTCRDEVRRKWVKVYKIKKGADPKVYGTMSYREEKRFSKGTYRVRVSYGYRYWNADTKKFSAWRTTKVSKIIKIK